MNLDDIEALIRKYLSTGMAVIVILVAPGTDTGGRTPPTEGPSPVTTQPDSTAPPDGTAEPDRTGGPDDRTEPFAPEPGGSGPEEADEPPPPDATEDRSPGDAEEPSSAEEPAPDATEEPAPGEAADLPDYEPPRPVPLPHDPGGLAGDDETDPHDETGTAGEPLEEGPDQDAERDEEAAEESTEPHPTDAGEIDPDLDARGPADGAEPGIDETDPTDRGATTEGTTAAEQHGWGPPDREDQFTAGSTDWDVYDGPGHAGEGVRSPDALTIEDSDLLVITGDPSGTTGGLSWGQGQKYGRWEGRVRAPESDPSYNALMLLWPDAEDFPVGGEIDFMEMLDPTRQTTDFFLHHGEDDQQVNAQVRIDGTQWHNWAVEWTPDAITGYVDGEEWFRNTDPSTFPPGPMHLCIQLDWFPEGTADVRESRMEVDWVRQWSLDETPRSDEEPAGVAPARATGSDGPIVDAVRRLFDWG